MNSVHLLYIAASVTRRLESNIGSSMSDAPRSESLLLGLRVMLLGMGMCFIILMLLWGVLELFRIFLYRKKPDEKQYDVEKAIEAADAPVIESSSYAGDELIAVITAAAAAYLSAEAKEKAAAGEPVPDTRFRVVSFRKKA